MNLISGIHSQYKTNTPYQENKVFFGKKKEVNILRRHQQDSFQKQRPQENTDGFRILNTSNPNYHFKHPRYEYKNVLPKPLKAEPNPDLLNDLVMMEETGAVHDAYKSSVRIASLSRYLKEDMVGFVTPDGENWFEGACEFLIKGSAGIKLPVTEYEKYAKQFWALMSMADKYWLSEDYINYLDGFKKPNPGVEATIAAIKDIRENQMVVGSNISFGYSSKLRYIDKLLIDGCAYSGQEMSLKKSNAPNFPTMEHIFPHVSGGEEVNLDCNYLLVSSEANGLRSDIPLLEYLKGWDADEYEQANPGWKKIAKKAVADKLSEGKAKAINRQDKKLLNRLIYQLKHKKNKAEAILNSVPQRLRQAFNDMLAQKEVSLDLTA